MSTRTRQPPRATTTGRRFARPGAAGRSSGRGVPRSAARFGRRRPQRSTGAAVLEGLTARLPGRGTARRGRGTAGGAKGKAGFAALAGVAALAFKNRERLTRLLPGNRSKEPGASPAADQPTAASSEERPAAA